MKRVGEETTLSKELLTEVFDMTFILYKPSSLSVELASIKMITNCASPKKYEIDRMLALALLQNRTTPEPPLILRRCNH